MLPGKMSSLDVIPSANAQGGRTRWSLYRYDRESDTAGTSRGSSLRTTGMEQCVQLLETSKRGGLSSSRIYLTGKVMCQGLTQMSYALEKVDGRRI